MVVDKSPLVRFLKDLVRTTPIAHFFMSFGVFFDFQLKQKNL